MENGITSRRFFQDRPGRTRQGVPGTIIKSLKNLKDANKNR